jgi:group I intron endonuclease
MLEVYCLTSPSGKRYVGFTSEGFDRRWSKHVQASKSGSRFPLHNAIRKYGHESFTRSLLERMTTEAGAKRAEQLWIKELGTFGSGGYNATLGGEGTLGLTHEHSPETRAKLADLQRGKIASPETRAKMSKAGRDKVLSPETRAKISLAHRGKVFSPETRAKLSEANRGKKRAPVSAETRAKIAEANRGRIPSLETRARMSEAKRGMMHSLETRARMSEAKRGKGKSPETRAKMSAAAKLRCARQKLKD